MRSGAAHRLRSGAAQSAPERLGRGPALPIAIWSSLFNSGAAHCNLELPVEAWRCPLQHTAGENDGEDDGKEEEDGEKEKKRKKRKRKKKDSSQKI